jgi:hypothetical protein
MGNKLQRVVDIKFVNSGLDIDSIVYNPAAGANKVLSVGPRLLPIPVAGGYTTNVTAVTALPTLGLNLAIYNNSGTVATVTTGNTAALTSQAIGVSDANGNVGVACAPNSYTYLSMGYNQYIIDSSANLIVYIIEDPTMIIKESGPYAQQNVQTQPIS